MEIDRAESEKPVIPALGEESDDPIRVRLLTVEQVAHALGLGLTTTWHLIMAGEIESVVIGKKARRVPCDAIDAYIRRLREQVRWLDACREEG